LTDNGVGIRVNFDLGTGSTRLGTAGAWGGAVYFGTTGSVQLISTLNATFYITGVQLEKGTQATEFDYRPFGTELQLCQRYFQKIDNGGSGNGYTNFGNATSYSSGAASFRVQVALPVKMRTYPSFSTAGSLAALGVVSGTTTVSLADGGGNPIVGLTLGISAGSTGQSVIFRGNNSEDAALIFSAEL
jgi:hypothetical protein